MINKIVFVLLIFFLFIPQTQSQVNTEKFRKDADTLGFSGSADLEIDFRTGNVDFQRAGLGGRLNYNFGDDYTFLVFKGEYGWQSGEEFSNEALVHLRNVYSLWKEIQLETFLQSDFNKSRLLLNRYLAGGGLRFKIFTTDNFKVRFGTAYFYEFEKYNLPENSLHGVRTFTHRSSSYITSNLSFNNNLNLTTITYFQPAIGKWEDYRIISENSLSITISKYFDIYTDVNLRYDNRPPDHIKPFDTDSKFGVSLKF